METVRAGSWADSYDICVCVFSCFCFVAYSSPQFYKADDPALTWAKARPDKENPGPAPLQGKTNTWKMKVSVFEDVTSSGNSSLPWKHRPTTCSCGRLSVSSFLKVNAEGPITARTRSQHKVVQIHAVVLTHAAYMRRQTDHSTGADHGKAITQGCCSHAFISPHA